MLPSKLVHFPYAQRPVPCNVCEDEVPGEYYCQECKQTLCPRCEKSHKRVAATKNHNIVLRGQVGDIDTTTLTCTDHGDQASFHCEKCNIPVCIKCVTGNHQGHKMVNFTEIFEKEKDLLQDDINKIKYHVLPELKKTNEEIKTKKEKYETKMKDISKDMEDEHHARLADLTQIHDDRIKTLGTMQVANVAKFDCHSKEINTKINSCEDILSKFEDANRKRSVGALMKLAKMQMPLYKIGSTIDLPDLPSFEPGNVNSIDAVLGKLHVRSSLSAPKPSRLISPTIVSSFKSPLQGSTSICITMNDEVWLGGDESMELVMVDIKGNVLRRRKIQNRPSVLAGMDCGDIIISPRNDSSNRPEDTDLYFHGRVVRVNGDGTKAKQIYKGSGDYSAIHAVEKTDGNTYIIDGAICAVRVINKDGNVLSTITRTPSGQTVGPVGLVVDKMGNILCADWNNNAVYIIDRNQQMRELVGRSHGIQYPRWLAVDKHNNLWITYDAGNVHVVKYSSP
ncbi:hypothetical protein FSP39_022578 [Pinctada imbricata]|uniref:B box-type domain-containing protein n=1 Tax=Pinctada imbricata TaxID=66713 RepID=A0AA88XVW9_PINIB|nr:hypothetical protein FSP39_022578 [Pinctada imbricata]